MYFADNGEGQFDSSTYRSYHTKDKRQRSRRVKKTKENITLYANSVKK